MTPHLRSLGSFVVAASFGLGSAAAQVKVIQVDDNGKVLNQYVQKQNQIQDRPDEQTALLKAVTEAYKAPLEVDKDIRDELRRQYQNYSTDREQKILREVRRLYVTNPEQEARIVLDGVKSVLTEA